MLHTELRRADALSPGELEQLFEIFAAHYEHVRPSAFRADLGEKDYVLLLREAAGGRPCGFSTQKILRQRVAADGTTRAVRAIFSGDTVVDRAHWGSQELVRAWCRFAGAVRAEERETPLYWFLICKGHRTYLYLPIFCHGYAPRHEAPTPSFEQAVLDALAEGKFGRAYRRETGTIEFEDRRGNLTPELAAIPGGRSSDARVRFFRDRNPRYAEGAELCCLAALEPANLKGLAARMFSEGERLGSVASLLAPAASLPMTGALA